jgi:hypothetical protein
MNKQLTDAQSQREMVHSDVRFLVDQTGAIHRLNVLADSILLDTEPAVILSVGADGIEFAPNILVESAVLGEAFAGPAPALSAIGALFGAYLHLCTRQQQFRQVFQAIEKQAMSAASQYRPGNLSLPRFCLDAITERALKRFDGSEEMATVIGDILGQPPALVKTWAAQMHQWHDEAQTAQCHEQQRLIEGDESHADENHSDRSQPDEERGSEEGASPSSSGATASVVVSPGARAWTTERLKHVEQALLASHASTLKEAIIEVASLLGCSSAVIHTQVYKHGINEAFKNRRSPDTCAQDDRAISSDADQTQGALVVSALQAIPSALPVASDQAAVPDALPAINVPSLVEARQDDVREHQSDAAETLFVWSDEMIKQLTTAFLLSEVESTVAACSVIAVRFGWPEKKVYNKVHSLHLPWRKQKQQHVATQPLLGKQDNELEPGSYAWRVMIDQDNPAQWYLSYLSSEFPEQLRGQGVWYQKQRYRVEKIFHQEIRLSRIAEHEDCDLSSAVPASAL